MDFKLSGKKAVVLAASSGIGKGIAQALADEGCDIAICARESERLKKVEQEIRDKSSVEVISSCVDLVDADSIDAFFDEVYKKFGCIDILINNAGGPPPGGCLDFSDDQYLTAFNLTFMSVVRACRRVVPGMADKKWGRIINIESTTMKCAARNMVLSNAFRAAVGGFTKTLSMEYARNGIRAHTIMPGPFLTGRVAELGSVAAEKQGISFDTWQKEAEERTALGRFGLPIELGRFVAFLSSDLSDYMNGTCIPVDGGSLSTIV